jgi:hypothetical protein
MVSEQHTAETAPEAKERTGGAGAEEGRLDSGPGSGLGSGLDTRLDTWKAASRARTWLGSLLGGPDAGAQYSAWAAGQAVDTVAFTGDMVNLQAALAPADAQRAEEGR